MGWLQPHRRLGSAGRTRRLTVVAVLAMVLVGAAFAVPAIGHQAPRAHSANAAAAHALATVSRSTGLANLPDRTAKISCAELASTTRVDGLSVNIAEHQEGSTAGGPEYCALTGHIAKYIGFEVLLPEKTWHERYLQVGCGGLCGSIGLSAPQSTGFKALADGYFVVASQDEGHNGQSVS